MDHNSFLKRFKQKGLTVVAVSKTKAAEQIQKVYDSGHLDFGENKVQELTGKYEVLPKDIRWHFIGHLQRNKIKYIAPFIHMIHSVDSLRLLETIDEHARKNNRVIKILLQVKIAKEETKFGLDADKVYPIIEDFVSNKYPNIKICGLMGMASFTDDVKQIDSEFAFLHDLFIELKEVYLDRAYYFKELSIGMSGDYEIALEHGATLLRVGTLIFGQRY